ncbi:unnamed protein product [Brassicogethes aeneus]|uniref:Rhabdoid tumor deletion region protein 1 n=1 Tax=Brassicogethes aeneus TaxID=1431903 RepID=A0A9P0B6M5_BRAAE|nr:unnamed protein product [Brassicogethes aeneus]
MFTHNKNLYLQKKLLHLEFNLETRLLDKCVERARNVETIAINVEPKPLTPDQPNIPVKNCDVTRRPLGFGRNGVLKIKRDLHDKDCNIRVAALSTLLELFRNPEIIYTGINQGFVYALVDLTLEEMPYIRERSLMVLSIIATVNEGKNKIVNNSRLLQNFKDLLNDDNILVRYQLAVLLKEVSESWEASLILQDNNFIKYIMERLDIDPTEIKILHLNALKNLMYCQGACQAIHILNAYAVFCKFLEDDNKYILEGALECLRELTTTKEGRNLAYKNNLLFKLNDLIHDPRPEVHIAAAGVMMNVTIKLKTKIVAFEFKNLPLRLINLAQNNLNPRIQLFCLETLYNICEYPKIRKQIQTKYEKEFSKIKVSSELLDIKKKLQSVLYWNE